MKRKLRKSLSWLLTFAMVISLFCGMIPTASAAEAGSNQDLITFDYTDTNLAGLYRTLHVVVQNERGEELDTLTVNDYYSTGSRTNTIRLNENNYVITNVGYSDYQVGHVFTFLGYGKDSCSFSFNFTSSEATVVLTVSEFEKPEVDDWIETGTTIEYRIYDLQLLKMLYLAGDKEVDADTKINDVTLNFIRDYTDDDWDFGYNPPAANALGYHYASLSDVSGNGNPYNIKEIVISYDNSKTAIIPARDLLYSKAGNLQYEIKANAGGADDTHIVAFYAQQGVAGVAAEYTLYAVRFVEDGKSFTTGGVTMPKDPEYGAEYEFTNWSYNTAGDAPFSPEDKITEDTNVYARRTTSGLGGSEIHVMNTNDSLIDRFLELYNAKNNTSAVKENINLNSVRIVVKGTDENGDEISTNPDYSDGTAKCEWREDNDYEYGYFFVVNYDVGNHHISHSAMEEIVITAEVNGESAEVTIPIGTGAGEMLKSLEGQEYIIELVVNPGPAAPDDEDITPETPEIPGILGKDAIQIQCVNDTAAHDDKTIGYDVLPNVGEEKSYSIGAVVPQADGSYTCDITIYAAPYVADYNEDIQGYTHELSGNESDSVTLKYSTTGWTPVAGETPITFNVTCDAEGGDTYHTITVSVTNGTVSYGDQTDKTELSFQVENNKNAEINLNANPDYVLDYAVLDDVDVSVLISTAGRYTFDNVTHNMTLTVVYAEDKKGTVDENGNETGDGIPDCRQVFIRYESANPNLGTVTPAFQTVNLERDKDQNLVIPDPIALTGVAIAKEGARFVSWTQNDEFFADEANLKDCVLKTFAPGGTYTFYANFEIDTQIPDIFTIIVIVHNGTATYKGAPIVDYIPVFEGDSPAITFTPNPGYEFDKATLNGADILIPSDGTYTIKNVQEDCTIEVWCTNSEEPEDPLTPPTNLEYLLEGYIHIQCANNPDHETLDCGLLKDSYTDNRDGLGLQGNSYVLQINSGNYAMYYDQVNKLDNIHTASGPNLIELTWDGTKWIVPKDGLTVKIFCNTEPEPEVPDASTPEEIADLLDNKIEIQCISDSSNHLPKFYGVWAGSYSVCKEDLEDNTYIISLNSGAYADKYNSDQYYTGEDAHSPYGGDVLVVLIWNGEEWTVNSAPIVVRVSCSGSTAPEDPLTPPTDLEQLLEGYIHIQCADNPDHKTLDCGLLKDSYKVTGDGLGLQGTSYVIQINSDNYAMYYDQMNKLENIHTASGPNLIELTWDGTKWIVPKDGLTVKIFCNTDPEPEAPDHSTLAELISVEVLCENLDAEHEKQEMALFGGTYSGTMSDSAPYTYTVTIQSAPYIINFDKEGSYGEGTHHLVRGLNDTVTLVWKNNNWQLEDGKNGIVQFHVTCKDEPQQPGTYMVTFDSAGGSDVPSQEVVSGNLATEPTAPTREGFTFAGWYLGDTAYNFNTPVTGNITLVAHWTDAKTYTVTIAPADITVYTGGEAYGAIVGENGEIDSASTSGLPEPGYHITLSQTVMDWLNLGTGEPGARDLADYLTFRYEDDVNNRVWKLTYLGVYSLNPTRYVYSMSPVNPENPDVRLEYIDGNDVHRFDDEIEMGPNAASAEYTMWIYGGEIEQRDIQAVLTANGDTLIADVVIETGTLTIRSTVDDNTTPIADTASEVSGGSFTAVDTGASYVVNDSQVEVPTEGDRIHLLVDQVSDSEDFNNAMGEAALDHADMPNASYETAYLDLVDAQNGNAVVTLEDGSVDIYWPMPEDADPSDTFQVVHYVDLNREVIASADDLDTQNIELLSGTTVHINGDWYVHFTTDSFSPFVLVWETAADPNPDPDPDPNPDPTPDPGDDEDDDHDRPHGGSDDSDPTGNLSIELDVNGGDDDFTFTVILTDKNGKDLENNFYYNGDYTGTIGSGDEITLEGGEKIVIHNLPEGTRYEVIIETADGYTYIIDGEEGIIRIGMNEAEFTANRTVSLADPSVTGVSRWLNTTDHIAYLTGYPSGAFGPNNSMTRAEVAQMFYALLNNKNVTITASFPDVPADAWYATAVNTLASLGMVSGDADGSFRPNDPITRAEFCVIALAFAYEPESYSCSFTDVSVNDWFYTYVAQAASYGWIGGYADGSFGPNDLITRAQVTTIVNNMLGREADRSYVNTHTDTLVQFYDLTRIHWAYYDIMEAVNEHEYTRTYGTEDWR